MELKKCAVCGKVFEEYELTDTVDGLVCDDCLDAEYVQCDDCGEYVRIDEIYTIGGYWFCGDCVDDNSFLCACCGERHLNDDSNDTEDGEVCIYCRDTYYIECEECGEVLREENAYLYDGECFCYECYNRIPQNILDYHEFKGSYTPMALRNEQQPLYLGIELEMEGNRKNSDFNPREDIFHYENDGSLSEGFEMISQPLSYNLWQKDGHKWLKEYCTYFKDNGMLSHSTTTCGLHIHACNEYINNIPRLLAIVNLFQVQMEQFARRRSQYYCRYLGDKSCYSDNDIKAYIKNEYSIWDRYQAVNLSNRDTVEFRFFRGTLNDNTLMACLDLVKGVIDMANSKQCVITFRDLLVTDRAYKYALSRHINLDRKIDITDFMNKQAFKGYKHKKEVK